MVTMSTARTVLDLLRKFLIIYVFLCKQRFILAIFSGQVTIEIYHPFILLRRSWYLTLT